MKSFDEMGSEKIQVKTLEYSKRAITVNGEFEIKCGPSDTCFLPVRVAQAVQRIFIN